MERSISDEANRANGTAKEQNIIADKEKDKDKEKVYLKASGRAIPRALEIGVYFQAEEDCAVKIEMGSVRVIDDIVVRDGPEADSDGGQDGVEDMDVPETRIRTISSVTVSVWLKGGGSLRDKKQVRELV